ncbi:DUF6572 domain-containing protein [Colwellia hornerae]|uniref:Uncharacterized protein n=1 Tax=Colwellia hornerae TaxID=89402 RepID=A0A5C6Q210_9GAMM|nr:DUF6572 domain-containing protein [Colwellia hornerae]TWX44434.1 hypothetical protein ESZ28_18955 [Colwellia hornerae]TWX53445.1 hypothetical protein ESZ26_18820 [Colwellia hornerae]TWX62026.1 hypothetical protein ESZ27_19005 [Colwellia hornerae]
MKYGISFQNKVDICSIDNGVCVLTLVQYEIIDESNIELLQSKLNHYLVYILDGQLEEEEPQKSALPKRIELIVGHNPTEILTDFINQLVPVLETDSISFVIRRQLAWPGRDN